MRLEGLEVDSSLSDALAWEKGCRADLMRNEFLIPTLIELFRIERPSAILDIGTGTGYIPRSIHDGLDYRPAWTLVDLDVERLRFMEQCKPKGMQVTCVGGSVSDAIPPMSEFAAVLLTFTLLEANDVSAMLASAIKLVADGGLLIIALPDVWRDVLAADEQDQNLSKRFLEQQVALTKTDKFTNGSYPFNAIRNESVITIVLRQFCILERLIRGGPEEGVFLFVFRKRGFIGQGIVCG